MIAPEERLRLCLKSKNLILVSRISKGWSSEAYAVKDAQGTEFALKMERQKSPRKGMAVREAANLKLANSAGVGPRLIGCDAKHGAILMELIGGTTFDRFIFSEPKPSAKMLRHFLRCLFAQAAALDKLGLDHGQLGGRGRNILVRATKSGKSGTAEPVIAEPVIIDFEKASSNRKAHNVRQLAGFLVLNKRSALARRVREILLGKL